jgi:hypothetical protein
MAEVDDDRLWNAGSFEHEHEHIRKLDGWMEDIRNRYHGVRIIGDTRRIGSSGTHYGVCSFDHWSGGIGVGSYPLSFDWMDRCLGEAHINYH